MNKINFVCFVMTKIKYETVKNKTIYDVSYVKFNTKIFVIWVTGFIVCCFIYMKKM